MRDIDTVRVPTELAAVRLDLADGSAAELIRAASLWVDEKWIAAVRAIRRTRAEVCGVRCAGFIPRARAAGWIEVTNERAATSV